VAPPRSRKNNYLDKQTGNQLIHRRPPFSLAPLQRQHVQTQFPLFFFSNKKWRQNQNYSCETTHPQQHPDCEFVPDCAHNLTVGEEEEQMPGGHLVLDYVAYVTSSLTRGFTTRHSPSLADKNEKKKTPAKGRLHLQGPTRIDPEELHNRLRDATWRPTSHFSDGQISSITSCKNPNSTTEPVLFLRFFSRPLSRDDVRTTCSDSNHSTTKSRSEALSDVPANRGWSSRPSLLRFFSSHFFRDSSSSNIRVASRWPVLSSFFCRKKSGSSQEGCRHSRWRDGRGGCVRAYLFFLAKCMIMYELSLPHSLMFTTTTTNLKKMFGSMERSESSAPRWAPLSLSL